MHSKKIIILSVALSLLAHALLISATGLLDGRPGKHKQETTITVNLKEAQEILSWVAKREDKDKGKLKESPAAPPSGVTESDAADQETISLDSNDERFVPYLKKVKKRIEHIWSYPPEAFAEKKGGVSTVFFSLDSHGRLVESKIIESSGHVALDQGTMNVIKEAAPYAPFPPEITHSRLNIQATFQYRFLE